MKPRILMLIDRPGWAYDVCARGLAKQLDHLYDFDFAYVREKPQIDPRRYDLIYVYFWGETYLNRFNPDPDRVIKEISSHRWAVNEAFGKCSPAEMVETFLGDAATRIATSERLFDQLSPHADRTFHCSNGYDADLFNDRGSRSGPLSIGWVGNPRDEAKRFSEIIEPLMEAGFPIRIAGGDLPHETLVDFYNSVDVICVASQSEGTPLPLLEAMASGCYPLCTDVGVVNEIVEHQENGLIVEGNLAAFEDAFNWCADHVEQLRFAGTRNAERMPQIRSWQAVADRFHAVFQDTLAWAHVPQSDLAAEAQRADASCRRPASQTRSPRRSAAPPSGDAMRIAFVTPEFVSERNYDGGLANYVHRAGVSLRMLGHEPHVIVASDRDECFDHDGIRIHRVDVRPGRLQRLARRLLRGYSPLLSILWQSFKLNQRLRQLQAQHPFVLAQYSSYLATALFRPRAIPTVVRLSSLESLWSRAYERDRGPVGPARLSSFLEQRCLVMADRLISPSQLLADATEKATGRDVRVVESPFVPFSGEFDSAIYREHLSAHRYVLFFGTVGLLKGVRCLAEILEPLLSRHKDLFFVFVGKEGRYGGRPMLEYVRAQAGEHDDRVLHFDRMPHASLYPIIDHAEAVVLPSRIDNFPNACIEAMSRGKIVVGTRGASFDQLIEDGVSGLLCEIDDRESLLAAIERALVTDRADAIGEQARARIDELRPELAGARLIEAYEELIESDSRRSIGG